MNPQSVSSYRPDIDGLRAFAVLMVALFHAFPATVPGGFIGVDIFFVISGYLICGIILQDLRDDAFTFRKFYTRRIRRIFPALILALVGALIFGWFALWPNGYKTLGKHVVSGACFFSNFQLWSESGYFDAAARSKPLLHLWSLGIEEQFYIFFPFLLWFCARKQYDALSALVCCWVFSFACTLLLRGEHAVAAFYAPWTRVWELLTGAILQAMQRRFGGAPSGVGFSRSRTRRQGRIRGSLPALCGGAGLCLGLVLARESAAWPGWQALLPVVGTALLIAAGPHNPISKYVFSNRAAVFIGKVSYPFYLWHWIFLSYAFIVLGELGENTKLLRIGLLLVSFVFSVLTYLFVEKPIRFGKRFRKEKLYVIVTLMIMVACAGQIVRKTDGVSQRDFAYLEENDKQGVAECMRGEVKRKQMNKACFNYTEVSPKKLSYCIYSETNFPETVAIVGDSHAMSAYWGIEKLGEKQQFNTVLLGWYVPVGNAWFGWKNSRQTVTNILLMKKDIKKIFMIHRVAMYMDGKLNNESDFKPDEINRDFNDGVPKETFRDELQNFVNVMRGAGKEVFIVAENPELPFSVVDYFGSPFSLSDPRKRIPPLPTQEVIRRQQPYLDLLKTVQGATLVETLDKFCPGETCRMFTEDGAPIYFDDNHLSRPGSDFQAEHILRPYLPGYARE